MIRTVVLMAVAVLSACTPPHAILSPFAVLPDTIYTNAGATPVQMVDSIPTQEPGKVLIGQYQYPERRILVSRVISDAKQQRKIVEHERCHVVLFETGLNMHTNPWYAELLCDAFASARVAELERSRKP